ncbi:hypothetical protein [Dyadobacter sp. CY312]|uniref:hypothetical protein n=1 Tax=Dyadobacter sp. CY312 TaxID=2907303 RepID=UPI001F2309EC|nr:hypothetical protein [Dyadobacter sp. CY312]MCE7044394.1 hypothetical protein [Dyadobacter sp. CY312]
MEIDKYYQTLDQLADDCAKSGLATHHFLENIIETNRNLFDELIAFRKSFVGAKELDEVRGYLVIGLFREYKGIERATCFVICFELGEAATQKSWKQRCEVYSPSQTLFTKAPHLFEHVLNHDLIDRVALTQIDDSEILQITSGFTYLDYALNPLIASWAISNFPDKKIYLRANPHKYFDKQPLQSISESVLMPANPSWWRKLTIHNRTKEGASYILEDCSPKDNIQQYWELHIKKIKRLEVIVKRSNNGNLSMMIEEITDIDNHGLLFGRCIHLDTDSKFGTDFENSVLNHLDLAINIYEGDAAKKRLYDNLASGTVTTDASYRTHLLRIEQISFKALFGFVVSFFKSQTLINEWLEDQFYGRDAQ